MENISFFELLLNEKNIAGVWVVIGACLAFAGVLSNNFFENKRRKKERQHTLIRDAYFGGLEYINCYFHKIASIASTGVVYGDERTYAASEKYYKLLLIASSDVIDAFTQLSRKNTRIIFDLSQLMLNLKQFQAEYDQCSAEIQNYLDMMNMINARFDEYNNQGLHDQSLWDLSQRQFDEAGEKFRTASEQRDFASKNILKTQISLLKKCMESMIDISPDMNNAIISMRYDLDRKLSKNDAQKINDSLNLTLEQLKEDCGVFIDNTERQLNEMMEED